MTRERLPRPALVVLICGAAIVSLTLGIRQSFGVFLMPVTVDLEVGRQVFGLAIAIQTLLTGLCGPIAGMLADRYGARWVLAAGAAIYTLGLWLAAASAGPASLVITLGVIIGVGMSAATLPVVLGAVGRIVPPQYRGVAFGVTTAGGSFGQFAVIPGAQALLDSFGWEWAFVLLSIGTLVALGCAFGMSDRPAPSGGGEQHGRAVDALREAAATRSYWCLALSFFVCGLHIGFIATHLPAYLADQGIGAATGAQALALVGLFNIFGSYIFGALGDRYGKKYLLSIIYGSRALLFAAVLLLPMTPGFALAFGAIMGFIWLGTVPPTSGLIAQIYGTRWLATLFGAVFMAHQIGGFLGAWFAGWLFDATGSYAVMWYLVIGFGVFAALVALPIDQRPLKRAAAGV
jgi:MFS family permease